MVLIAINKETGGKFFAETYDPKAVKEMQDRFGIENIVLEEEPRLKFEKASLNAKRDALLKEGTLTKNKKLWFNIDTAQMFISGFSTLDVGESMPWRDANRKVVTLSYVECKAYVKEIRIVLQAFYGLTNP